MGMRRRTSSRRTCSTATGPRGSCSRTAHPLRTRRRTGSSPPRLVPTRRASRTACRTRRSVSRLRPRRPETSGTERLHGIDNYPAMIDTIEAYKPLLPDDLASRLCVVKGDAAEMPYDDGEFDVLLSIEAISHYLDVDGFLREASRVLRPGGTMIVS